MPSSIRKTNKAKCADKVNKVRKRREFAEDGFPWRVTWVEDGYYQRQDFETEAAARESALDLKRRIGQGAMKPRDAIGAVKEALTAAPLEGETPKEHLDRLARTVLDSVIDVRAVQRLAVDEGNAAAAASCQNAMNSTFRELRQYLTAKIDNEDEPALEIPENIDPGAAEEFSAAAAKFDRAVAAAMEQNNG